jgi:hypothetical protein
LQSDLTLLDTSLKKKRRRAKNEMPEQLPQTKVELSSLLPFEDADMQERWLQASQGRSVIDIPAAELRNRQLVYSGVPMKYRLQLWAAWTSNKGSPAVEMAKLQSLASDRAIREIAQDLPRTQPSWFDDAQMLSLQDVLLAYAGSNPTIGYCQGMNFIVATFIALGFGDAETFDGLKFLMEDICPDCHASDLGGFHRDARVLDKLVQKFLPSMHADFLEIGVFIDLLAVDHFMSLTSRNWPLASTVRLWDVILLEGAPALFASFLALLELYMPIGKVTNNDLPASVAPDGHITASDAMAYFKEQSIRGVTDEIDVVMGRTRKYAQLISENDITRLRDDMSRQ